MREREGEREREREYVCVSVSVCVCVCVCVVLPGTEGLDGASYGEVCFPGQQDFFQPCSISSIQRHWVREELPACAANSAWGRSQPPGTAAPHQGCHPRFTEK